MLKNEVANFKIADLRLSEEMVTDLHLNGIDTLEDLKGFSIVQLKKYVFRESEEKFSEITPVLKKYEIPTVVENLSLSKELTEKLKENEITLTDDLINIKQEIYDVLVENDAFFAQELATITKFDRALKPPSLPGEKRRWNRRVP